MVLLGIVGVVALGVIVVFNRLVTLRNQIKNAFSQIDVQLKRRYDLIPNLVESVKGFMTHEQATLQAVIAARNQAVSANNQVSASRLSGESMQGLMQAEAALGSSLGKLFALVESYPDLKSQTSMNELMEELRTTENRVAFARQHYNDTVTSYNTARETFPSNLISGPFGFAETPQWVVENAQERENIKVKF